MSHHFTYASWAFSHYFFACQLLVNAAGMAQLDYDVGHACRSARTQLVGACRRCWSAQSARRRCAEQGCLSGTHIQRRGDRGLIHCGELLLQHPHLRVAAARGIAWQCCRESNATRKATFYVSGAVEQVTSPGASNPTSSDVAGASTGGGCACGGSFGRDTGNIPSDSMKASAAYAAACSAARRFLPSPMKTCKGCMGFSSNEPQLVAGDTTGQSAKRSCDPWTLM